MSLGTYNINVQPCTPTSQICVQVNTSELSPSGFCSGSSCNPHNPSDIKFYNFHASNVDAVQLSTATYGAVSTALTFQQPSAQVFRSQARYVIANSREFFTYNAEPGTFYVECSGGCVPTSGSVPYTIAGTVYYIAQDGETPNADTILMPQSPAIVQAASGANLQNVTLQGLAFAADNFQTVPGGYVNYEGQPNIPAALSFINTKNVRVDSSIIAHTSGWGIEFSNDYYVYPNTCSSGCVVHGVSSNNQLTNSVVADVGTSGIRLGRVPPDVMDTGNSQAQATQGSLISG